MPTATYTPIANTTLAATATTVTFSSISSAYTDLVLVIQPKFATTGTVQFNFNSDVTVANYPRVILTGSGTSTSSTSFAGTPLPRFNDAFNNGIIIANIMDYKATTKLKSYIAHAGSAVTATSRILAGQWQNAGTAISGITLVGSNAFQIDSTFALYGIVS